MPDQSQQAPASATQPKATDAIPHALAAAGSHLLALDFLIDFVLGVISIGLGTWYALSRPGIAVLAVAVCLAGYVLIHVWRHLMEHPRRARGSGRRPGSQMES